jgi:hypothetical protein
MSKKTSPLSDDLVIARATFLGMLDALHLGVDVIEASTNAAQRAEAIAALHVMIEEVKGADRLTSDINYIVTHEKGQKSSSQRARNVRLKPSKSLDDYLEKQWFSLDKKPHQDTFVKEHYPIFCGQEYETETGANASRKKLKRISEKQFKKRLSPSQRRKPVAP